MLFMSKGEGSNLIMVFSKKELIVIKGGPLPNQVLMSDSKRKQRNKKKKIRVTRTGMYIRLPCVQKRPFRVFCE